MKDISYTILSAKHIQCGLIVILFPCWFTKNKQKTNEQKTCGMQSHCKNITQCIFRVKSFLCCHTVKLFSKYFFFSGERFQCFPISKSQNLLGFNGYCCRKCLRWPPLQILKVDVGISYCTNILEKRDKSYCLYLANSKQYGRLNTLNLVSEPV